MVNLEPSIQAAFVDFGVGRNGFLHISDVEPQYAVAPEVKFVPLTVSVNPEPPAVAEFGLRLEIVGCRLPPPPPPPTLTPPQLARLPIAVISTTMPSICRQLRRRDGIPRNTSNARIAPLPAPYCSHGSVQHLSVVQTRQLANPLHDLRSFFYARLTSDFFLKLGFD